jgi:hypothetical protein
VEIRIVNVEIPDLIPLPIIGAGEWGVGVLPDPREVCPIRALDVGGLEVHGIQEPAVRPGADLAEVRVGRDLKGVGRGPRHQGEGEEEGERQPAERDHNRSSIDPH